MIQATVRSHPKEIEPGVTVGRVLPSVAVPRVGPFIFLDHMAPRDVPPGGGVDVRPHPHIGLATVTYLFDGELEHRDSLGSHVTIRPGAVNWMSAGRGIVHSERTPAPVRARGGRMHGIQLWVGLPQALEQSEPSFRHYPAEAFPSVSQDGARVRLLAGEGWGARSPVETLSPVFFADLAWTAGSALAVPASAVERAVYVVEGTLRCGDEDIPTGTLASFQPGREPRLEAKGAARAVLIGGAPLDGAPRTMWWNFVSSSKDRIVQAARDWRAGAFPKVPGDEMEFVALDREPRFPPG